MVTAKKYDTTELENKKLGNKVMSEISNLAPQYSEAVLQWYIDNGVDEAMSDKPIDRLSSKSEIFFNPIQPKSDKEEKFVNPVVQVSGTPESKIEAIKLATNAASLEELKLAIMGFEGLSLKKTATNMVFADGPSQSHIMVIGDAPEAEDDRAGIPFSGEIGALANKMFAAIGLYRQETDPAKSIYLTNVLNWRPPGNRSPTIAEIELSIPFIRRHIELIKPKVIYLMGGVASKAVLQSDLAIGKLRGKTHFVKWDDFECPAMVSFHPSFLIRSPLKKKEAWEDLLLLKQEYLQS